MADEPVVNESVTLYPGDVAIVIRENGEQELSLPSIAPEDETKPAPENVYLIALITVLLQDLESLKFVEQRMNTLLGPKETSAIILP